MAVNKFHTGQNTSGERWVLTGLDGCRDSYEVTFCAPVGAIVEAKFKFDYNAINDTYSCPNGNFGGIQQYLQTAYINNVCVVFCGFGSGLASAAVRKIGFCSCSADSCRVECATSSDGFCCIKHSKTDQLLSILAN